MSILFPVYAKSCSFSCCDTDLKAALLFALCSLLSTSAGAISRLKFFYDQQHRHLSDGVEDYRMTFTGEYDDVKSALSNITVAFPWLDTAYTAPELIIPYPYKGWPRTGRTFYGSNILRMRISDVPGQFTYIERPNRMWLVKVHCPAQPNICIYCFGEYAD